MRGSLTRFVNADFGLRIQEAAPCPRPQSEILILQFPLETPRRGQGAQCPDRLIAKKAVDLRQIFSE
jgi:hypothetical protein